MKTDNVVCKRLIFNILNVIRQEPYVIRLGIFNTSGINSKYPSNANLGEV